ncbi:MAG: RNA-binding transcriptional accessory protein [Tannerella sp.]|nr:RNA-binding transcriptional accessory protein [Tannerella sp.]
MNKIFPKLISEKLQISEHQVENTLQLLDEGATIPFISRYRKELTGGLDEVKIGDIADEYKRLREIEKRKETIFSTIEGLGKLTDELRQKIEETWSATELEDIYLPFKPKRRTRAQIALEKGLEPLAILLMSQKTDDVEGIAHVYVTNTVKTIDEALSGARDIIAEWVNENAKARNIVRNVFEREAFITSKVVKGKEKEGDKYLNYFDVGEPLKKISSHRLLAMRRGESEGFLRIDISPDEEHALERLIKYFVKTENASGEQVKAAIKDCYKRLLKPSIETEFAALRKEKADKEAILIFEENLRQLLLSPPLGQKRVLAIDPGFRTGCKIVCLDEQGKLLHNETIYPHLPQRDYTSSMRKMATLVEQFNIQAIAIGNGTAGRETEMFVQNVNYDHKVQIFSVSESGASIYSASKVAREEFPDYDVTVRGAVSIGRRLMDPLAELVKIDPKSIGVGQYQHDVNQIALKDSLDKTVEHCVNKVGVNLNTASKYLLTYISGVGATLAQNIVDYRSANGAFRSRKELMKVAKMGAKSFEQSAGFLRIQDAENPLDNSAVHPESYHIVEKMAKDLNCNVFDLLKEEPLRNKIVLENYISENVGLPTLQDIVKELSKPGRDPRETIKVFEFDPNIREISDLRQGMVLPGIVTNITKFGAFVDIGIKENGLVHVSQLSEKRIYDPSEIVKLNQHVSVKVLEVDKERKRISLSMKLET